MQGFFHCCRPSDMPFAIARRHLPCRIIRACALAVLALMGSMACAQGSPAKDASSASPATKKSAEPARKKPAPARSVQPRPAPPPPAIRIGEINSYRAHPAFLEPYRQGWQLALDEINAQGGALGRKLEVLSRDDGGTPEGALRAAAQLAERNKVQLLFGGFASEVGLALSEQAARDRGFYLAAAPMSNRLTWELGNDVTYRLAPSSWMQVAALAPKALGLRKRRWAIVYPDNEYGLSSAATFKSMMLGFQARTEIVAELAAPAGGAKAGDLVSRLEAAKPDAIFSTLYGTDLIRFVREGQVRGLFQDRAVVAALAGQPEMLQPLAEDIPAGWLVTGHTCDALVDTPARRAFAEAFRSRYGTEPGAGATLGYIAMQAMAAGLRRAGSDDPQAVARAFSGLDVDTPYGPVRFRALDHQATLGVCLSNIVREDGTTIARPLAYLDGSRLQPPEKVVRRLRGAEIPRETAQPRTSQPAGNAATDAKPEAGKNESKDNTDKAVANGAPMAEGERSASPASGSQAAPATDSGAPSGNHAHAAGTGPARPLSAAPRP